jgi:hypothetical protein
MRAKNVTLVVASAALLMASLATAPAQSRKSSETGKAVASDQRSEDWRARAMQARAEAPDDAPRGNARAVDERGDRRDGEEAGGGRLRKDGGDGGAEE